MDASESIPNDWVKGLRSIREDPDDFLGENQKEELTAQENETQSDDARWQDDGGESAEAV